MNTETLRKKILDLAIRGKLVPQDPNDEPASVLLERIRTQKAQMVKDGKLKAKDVKNDTIIYVGEDNLHYEKFADGTIKCIEDEIPFPVPKGWEWTRIKDIMHLNPRNNLDDMLEVSFIPMSLIDDGYSGQHTSKTRIWKEVKNGFTHFAEGDIGIAKITPCFENRKSTVFRNLSNGYGAGTTELHILRPYATTILPDYLLTYFKSSLFIKRGKQKLSGAVGQQRVGKNVIENAYIPIPPKSEQNRIVRAVRETFIVATFIQSNTQNLIETLNKSKNKILDLAIRGKLVPQNDSDEPASVLLERIRAEKEELIKQGKIKRDKRESVIYRDADNSYYERFADGSEKCIDEEIPFEIPRGWAWGRIFSITTDLSYGTAKKSLTKGKIAVIRMGNIQAGEINYDDLMYSSDEADILRYCLEKNDLLFNRTNSPDLVGKTAIYRGDMPAIYAGYLIRIHTFIDSEYLNIVMNSNYARRYYNLVKTDGVNQSNINAKNLAVFIIPIPPFEEQRRIAKQEKTIRSILFECMR